MDGIFECNRGLDRNRSVNQGFLVTGRQPDIHFICPSQTVKSHCVEVVPHNGETRYTFI